VSENGSEREGLIQALIQALLMHRLSSNGACACGGRADSANPLDLTRHVADALLAAGFGGVAAAKAEAMDEAALIARHYRDNPSRALEFRATEYRTTATA